MSFKSKFGSSSAGLNLELCILIRFMNKVVVITAPSNTSLDGGNFGGMPANSTQNRSDLVRKWFELLKYFGVL